jgi:hypothetical protein
MNYEEALNKIINDGIEAAKQSYAKPGDELKLNGAIAGFEACRGLSPTSIGELMKKAFKTAEVCAVVQDPEYWYWRCRALEIQWVANVISAILDAQRLPVIVHPTVRGVKKAAEIIGVGG